MFWTTVINTGTYSAETAATLFEETYSKWLNCLGVWDLNKTNFI